MTTTNEIIVLQREVEARMVPSGAVVQLPKYTEVTVTQQLGDSFTVNIYGNLARIEGKNADALGKIAVDPLEGIDVEHASLEDLIWAYLKTVYDPEIPVNIVELGLIYDVQAVPLGKGDHQVNIKMTLTAPGCGMGPVLAEEVKHKLMSLDTVSDATVEIVFDPPWNQSMMSQAARLQLGMM